MSKNKSVEELNEQIKSDPENQDLYMQRAQLFFELGNYENAEKDYAHLLESGCINIEIIEQRGHLLTYYIKDYEEALGNYNFALYCTENLEKAKANLEKSEADKEKTEELYRQFRANDAQLEKAREIYANAKKEYDDLTDLNFYKSFLYLRQGRAYEKLEYYYRADESYKNSDFMGCGISIMYKKQADKILKNIEKPKKHLFKKPDEKILYRKKGDSYYNIAILYKYMKDSLDDIKEEHIHIINADTPTEPEYTPEKPFKIIVNPPEEKKEIDEIINTMLENATKEYNKIIDLGDNYGYGYLGRGNVYFFQKKYKKALADYKEYKKIQTKDKEIEFDIKFLEHLINK